MLNNTPQALFTIDASGLQCPMPLLKLKQGLNNTAPGDRLRLIATDPASTRDIARFCEISGHTLVGVEQSREKLFFTIEKML